MTSEIVRTAGGEVRGERTAHGGLAWRGIPYAAARRWAPPAPVAAWAGERDARTAGPVCPQPARPFSEWAHGPLPATDEDSLTVNVWTPPGDGPWPVFVFLHGGGWALGWGSNPLLDGTHLAPALDAVVVTLNYRLGSLGWLWHSELAAEPGGPCGNWGMLDQLAALHWVADNVGAFGGDPARVTLAGESAGAGSVLHLLADPAADGLFTRAIAQSPPLHELIIDASRGRAWTEALLEQLAPEVDGGVAARAAAARELPAGAIVDAHEALLGEPAFRGTRGGAMPIVDPVSLPADPAATPEVSPDVPVLIGTNADEGTFFFRAGGRRADPDDDRLVEMVAHLTHAQDPWSLIESQRGAGLTANNDILCAIVTEAWFAGPVTRWSAARAAAGGTVHRYRIDHPSDEDDLGATHSISVPLVFASWRDGGVPARLAGTSAQTVAVSAAIDRDWRAFVHGETLDWPPLAAGDSTAAAQPKLVYGGTETRSVQGGAARVG